MSHGIRIKDLPESDRPRERLAKHGAHALRSAELIAILLRTGTQGNSALQMAEELLQKFGTLQSLACATLKELQQIKGIGPDKAIALHSAFTLAHRMAQELQGEAPLMDTPGRIADYLRDGTITYKVEHFQAVLLNSRKRLIRVAPIGVGLVDQVLVHPREIFKPAIEANASSLVLVHNHPSGDPTPSEADIRVTRDMIRAGQLLKIEVLDHLVFGHRTEQNNKGYVSMRELGFCYA